MRRFSMYRGPKLWLDINGRKRKVGFNSVLWCVMCELGMHTNKYVSEWFRIRRKCAEHCTDMKKHMQCQSMFSYPKPLHPLQMYSLPILWFFHTVWLITLYYLIYRQINCGTEASMWTLCFHMSCIYWNSKMLVSSPTCDSGGRKEIKFSQALMPGNGTQRIVIYMYLGQ